ncbi:metallophosphoesterase family protein [Candidatus Fermentibacteria bacterium]|nr:metallophosphoesterase family protein [Candidatus Fermentibacteria bacterium]
MRVAVLGGIRANLPALDTVVADARQHRVDAIWNVGNFTGFGPFPGAVIDRLQELGALSVLGRDELLLLKLHQMEDTVHRTMQHEFVPLRYAQAHLSEGHHRFLRSVPRHLELTVAGVRVLLVHGSPSARLPHQATLDHLRILADESHAQVVVYGHEPTAGTRRIRGVVFMNPGSVGQSHDGDPRASYAVMTITERVVRTSFRRVDYPVESTAVAMKACGLPAYGAEALRQGVMPETAPPEAAAVVPERNADSRIEAVLELARSCEYEAEHTHQVARLSLKLFDDLAGLHMLGTEERFLLHCAALLHDIGWIEGQQAHHKTALRIILSSTVLPFDERDRLLIGMTARYHRKALPKPTHGQYMVLAEEDRRRVAVMAGILRVADGLDRTHRSLVDDFTCQITPKRIAITCLVRWPAEMERQAALDKGQLLESALGKHLAIEWRLT